MSDTPDNQEVEFQEIGALYTEDGYCVACGNGNWKSHMPQCKIADLQARISELEAALEPFALVAEHATEILITSKPGLAERDWENAARVLRKDKEQ